MIRFTLFTSAALIGALGLSAGAARAQPTEERREMVRYADLDIGHPAGVHVLLSHIRAASARVCDVYSSPMDLIHNPQTRECMSKSQADAVRDLALPELTAAFEGRAVPNRATYAQVAAVDHRPDRP